MKNLFAKIIFFLAFACLFADVKAQLIAIEDILRASTQDYEGSARFVAMAGAFGALGGDIAGIGVNPAGIAIFRRNHLSMSLMGKESSVVSKFDGNERSASHTTLNLPSIGAVLNTSSDNSALRILIGLAYQQKNNYSRKVSASGNYANARIMDFFAGKASADPNLFNHTDMTLRNVFDRYNPVDFDVVMAYNTYLVDYGENGDEFIAPLAANDLTKQQIDILYKGWLSEIAINVGMDYNDKLFFGVSLGVPQITYSSTLDFSELAHNSNTSKFSSLNYKTNLRLKGSGINFKFGTIYKPVSFLRIGLAFHLPDYFFYQATSDEEYVSGMENLYYASMDSYFNDGKQYSSAPPSDYYLFFDRMKTPFKSIGSLAYIFGKRGLLSVDFEHADYSRVKISGKSPTNEFNAEMKKQFRNTLAVRVGGEARFKQFSLRTGYAYRTSPDQRYDLSRTTYSVGAGYRFRAFDIDLAYTQASYYDFFTAYAEAKRITEKSTERKLFLTVGWSFD